MDNQKDIGFFSTQELISYKRGVNYFLGIGIDAYNSPQRPLRNCVNDITTVRDVLVKQYDFESDNSELLVNERATRKSIIKTLQETLNKLTESDSLILMYSGHGHNLQGSNVGFMVPCDAIDDGDYINLSDIKSRLDAAEAKHIFIIFDSCFSGLILTQRDVRAHNIPENLPSRYALTSGRNSPVDDGLGSHSPFAQVLIEELRGNDDALGSLLLSQKILDRFRVTGTDKDQLPDFGRINNDTKFQGQYYFYPRNYEISLARERTKRLEAEVARQMAESALIEAENERKKAEKSARCANNVLLFTKALGYDFTLAVNVMWYCQKHYEQFSVARPMYDEITRMALDEQRKHKCYEKILSGHTGYITSVQFSPDGNKLLTSSSDKTARIWDIQTCRVEKIFIGHKLSVTSAVFSPKDNVVLTCSEDKTACLWDINTGDKTITLSGHDRKINVANFSPDGTKILTGSSDGTAKLWDATSGKEIRTFYEYSPHSTSVYAIAFYGSTKILTGDKSNRLVLWDIDTGKQIQHFSGGIIGSRGYMSNPINSIAVQDGFVLTAEAGISKYWSIEKAELFDIFMGHSKTVSSVDLAESWALTGSHDNSAILWRKRYCDFLNKTVILKGHDDAITCVRFSRNEEKLATASFDKTVKIWDINLYTLNTGPLNLPHKEYYSAYEFSLPDLVNKGLQIEPEDVPQYIKEIFHSSQVEGFNKDNAFNNAKLYIKDSSLLEKIKRDLGLLNDA